MKREVALFDGMFDVCSYEGFSFDEICARYVRRGVRGRILGPELTDKFSEWLLVGCDILELPRDRGVAGVTGGEGALNGMPVRKGDRLVFVNETRLTLTGSAEVIVCY